MTTVKRNITIWVVLIPAIAAIIVAFIQFYPFKTSGQKQETAQVFSGTIVEANSNKPISQAEITIVGINLHYYSEDNGNFRLQVKNQNTVRVRVRKTGYYLSDNSYDLPSEGNIIILSPSN